MRVPSLLADRRAGLGPLNGFFVGRRSGVAGVASVAGTLFFFFAEPGNNALKNDAMLIIET
jgi:hypothetical protein